MDSPNVLVRELRLGAGLSQRALARRAGTSQPAVARYERGAATPSWETLQRLAAACGQRLKINAEPIADPEDVELAKILLRLTPEERLQALRRYARMHGGRRDGVSRKADASLLRPVGDVEN
jgi:uncharacterized protein